MSGLLKEGVSPELAEALFAIGMEGAIYGWAAKKGQEVLEELEERDRLTVVSHREYKTGEYSTGRIAIEVPEDFGVPITSPDGHVIMT